jgi:hypothetical protein
LLGVGTLICAAEENKRQRRNQKNKSGQLFHRASNHNQGNECGKLAGRESRNPNAFCHSECSRLPSRSFYAKVWRNLWLFRERFKGVSTKPVLSEVEGLDMTSQAGASIGSFIRLQPQIIALQSFQAFDNLI